MVLFLICFWLIKQAVDHSAAKKKDGIFLDAVLGNCCTFCCQSLSENSRPKEGSWTGLDWLPV